jgi:UDP-N-acetylglucosamine acyltransferase
LTTLGGHVVIANHVVTGGLVAVAPFVRLGRGCFLAGGAMVERDVPPYTIVSGDRARVRGINSVGLRRLGISSASRDALVRAYRRLWKSDLPLLGALALVEQELASDPCVAELVNALREYMACPRSARLASVRSCPESMNRDQGRRGA